MEEILEKALDLATEELADRTGSCPLDLFDYDLDCDNNCDNQCAECFKKMFIEKAKEESNGSKYTL